MTIKIVTDSSITIEEDLLKELDIKVVPLSVLVDGVLYSDADLKEEGKFRQLMQASKDLPKTSQPPVGLFAEVYQELAEAGADQIISIHITSSLSGTIEAARQGAQLSGAAVTILDSTFTDQAMKFQVVKAAQLAQAGASLDEILEAVQAVKDKTELFMGISTLENLVKGGRIGRVSGLLSNLLNIKVIMELKDANLHPLVKGRGNKTFTKWMEELLTRIADRPVAEVAISYSGNRDLADQMAAALQSTVTSPISILETGSIIQTHTGEGAFAIMIRYA